MYTINFLAYAYDKHKHTPVYNSFIIPFTFFALHHNENSHVEIIVEDVDLFKRTYEKELKVLSRYHTDFLIRDYQVKHNRHIPNTYRFFEKPVVKSKYTYITDIDIMYLETNLVEKYEQFWPPNLPYNNIIRYPNSVRLTGVFMLKNDEYYTNDFLKIQKKYYDQNVPKNDEVILGQMCQEVHGLPNFDHRMRPIYGIHFSPNRGKGKQMELHASKIYYDKYMKLKSEYPELFALDLFEKLTIQLTQDFLIDKPKVKPKVKQVSINDLLRKIHS